MKSYRLLLISFSMMFSASAMADAFYCGTHIIDENSNQTEVLEHCGEPDNKQFEQWTYARGEEPDMLIHFEADGTINRIEELTE
jgi:hypothetical protein